jgi:predicted NBD/HSP70 family sugar kinase
MANQRGRNVRDVRRSNRSLLLRQLYFRPQASRLELSRATGLSAASVSSVIAELIDAGVVVESGAVESEGGRPRIQLEVAASRFQVIGVDVGETRVRVERFDLALNELERAEIPVTPGRYEPDGVVAGIAAGLAAVGGPEPGRGTELLGIGIGVPGIVVGPPESVVHCQTIGWDAVPLEALLRAVTDLPLFIDNGANTLGQAEMWFGAGRGASDTLFLLIGSGIGASVTVDGVAYRGSSTSAGEWGHITAAIGGRLCRCGARGCLEAYIGAESVIARYAETTGGAPDLADAADEESALLRILAAASSPSSTSQGTTSQDTASPGTTTARAEAARAVLDETALHLGVSIGNLVNLFNPERIIIGGWAGLLMAPELLPRVQDVAREHALRYPFGKATIELGRLGPDAVARGAATLPVARFLNTAGGPARGAS